MGQKGTLMQYTDLENEVIDQGTEDEETIIRWRVRRRKVQIKCPRCDNFFDVPKDIKIDDNGYLSSSIYHYCEEQSIDGIPEENEEGWAVLAHLVDWGVK